MLPVALNDVIYYIILEKVYKRGTVTSFMLTS